MTDILAPLFIVSAFQRKKGVTCKNRGTWVAIIQRSPRDNDFLSPTHLPPPLVLRLRQQIRPEGCESQSSENKLVLNLKLTGTL